MTLDLAAQLPEVASINLGGGFKVGRMPEEPSVDMADVGAHVRREIEGFRDRSGRGLHLEIEPGTFLVANAGVIVASCVDVVDTGAEGYCFAKLDAGMPEITRPSLYGAQHPIDVLAAGREQKAVVFVGPCCESGDILTPAPGDPEALAPRWVADARGSGTWWWSAARAPTARRWPRSTTTPIRRRPRSCSAATARSPCSAAARPPNRSGRTRPEVRGVAPLRAS